MSKAMPQNTDALTWQNLGTVTGVNAGKCMGAADMATTRPYG